MKVVIEGNINCGKTTFINHIKRRLNNNLLNIYDSGSIFFNQNPDFNLLQLSEQDPLKWTFLKQLTFMKFLSHIQNTKNKKINIFSRSLFSAHHVSNAFHQNEMSKEEFDYLEKTYHDLLLVEKDIDILFFFMSDFNYLEQRTTENIYKKNIPQYQKYYNTLLDKIKPHAKLYVIIDSHLSIEDLPAIYDNYVELILDHFEEEQNVF